MYRGIVARATTWIGVRDPLRIVLIEQMTIAGD